MIDIESMLLPISADAVCGENLAFSAEFDTILALQQEDDPTLDQGDWVTPLKVADWTGVQQRCATLLTQRTKDLRLAMWWTEACARNTGYPGLLAGILLCEQLCVRYWDQVHPLPEGADQEERAGNIGWFLQRVAQLSALCPVTQRRGGANNYCLQDLRMARTLTPAQAQSADAGLTVERFGQTLKDTPRTFVQETLHTLEQCLEALARWQSWLDNQLGEAGPNFVPPREALERAFDEVRRFAKELGMLQGQDELPHSTGEQATQEDGLVSEQAHAPGGGAMPGPIRSTADALARLREIAAFFRRTQPHSPVAYLVDKAVQWGEMPLHEWLRAVVKDDGTLTSLQEMLGVSPTRD